MHLKRLYFLYSRLHGPIEALSPLADLPNSAREFGRRWANILVGHL